MRRLVAAIVLAMLGTQAFADVQSECLAVLADVAAPLGGAGGEQVSAAANGWCQVDLANPEFVAAQIEWAAFRIDQLPNASAGGRAVGFDLAGVKTPTGAYDGTVAFSIQDRTGTVQVHGVRFIGDDGREFLCLIGEVTNARGTLGMAVQFSENAKDVDVTAPVLSLGRAPDDIHLTRAFASAMDGVRVDATWKPGRM